MKKTTLQIRLVVGLVILMTGAVANAQTQYRAHIPFSFTIGEKSYNAGDYNVDVLNSDTSQKMIRIQEAKGRRSYLTVGTLGADYSGVTVPKLAFNCYGTRYALSMISTPSFIVKFTKSKAEEIRSRNQEASQSIVALTRKN